MILKELCFTTFPRFSVELDKNNGIKNSGLVKFQVEREAAPCLHWNTNSICKGGYSKQKISNYAQQVLSLDIR